MSVKLYADDDWVKTEDFEPFAWRHYQIKVLTNISAGMIKCIIAEYLRGVWYDEDGTRLDKKAVTEFRRLGFLPRQRFGQAT